MSSANRRRFLKIGAATIAGGLVGYGLERFFPDIGRGNVVRQGKDSIDAEPNSPEQLREISDLRTASAATLLSRREYAGNNLLGWEVVLGDGVYAAPGESPVNSNDIETVHYSDYSELRANILIRRIMAHNITFKRIYDTDAFKFTHTGSYKFRLPYQPSTSNPDLNGETLEGHLAIWDGANTKLDYLVAFQWILNPWGENFGAIQAWDNPGVWRPVGQLTPDTSWHEVQMVLDTGRTRTEMVIDGTPYQSYFATTQRDEWGDEIAARLACEIISLYPGEEGDGALHKAYFKDWNWIWEPRRIFLPLITKNG